MPRIVDAPRPVPHRPPNRFDDSSSDDDDEDEEQRRLREEEGDDQERLLSEHYGEAAEAPRRRKKAGGETDQDIEAEYDQTTRPRKKPRPTLTPADVTSARGLIRIKSEFSRQVPFPKTRQTTAGAAAAYSRALVDAYKSFCYDLFPGMAFEDVLTRIESFGSKKEVKPYLQSMREEVRNNHLEKLFGKEQANRMVEELEHGLKQQHEMGYDDGDDMMGMEANVVETRGARRLAEMVPSNEDNRVQEAGTVTHAAGSEQQLSNQTLGERQAAVQDDLQDTDDELDVIGEKTETSRTAVASDGAGQDDLQDTDDEAEAVPVQTDGRDGGNQKPSGPSPGANVDETPSQPESEPFDGNANNDSEEPDKAVQEDLRESNGDSQDPEERTASGTNVTEPAEDNESEKEEEETTSLEHSASGDVNDEERGVDTGCATQSQAASTQDGFPLGQETPSSENKRNEEPGTTPSNDEETVSEPLTLIPSPDTQSQVLTADEETATIIPTATMDSQLESPADEAIESQDASRNSETPKSPVAKFPLMDPSQVQFSPLR